MAALLGDCTPEHSNLLDSFMSSQPRIRQPKRTETVLGSNGAILFSANYLALRTAAVEMIREIEFSIGPSLKLSEAAGKMSAIHFNNNGKNQHFFTVGGDLVFLLD